MNRCVEKFIDDIIRIYPVQSGVIQHVLPEVAQVDRVSYTQMGFANYEALAAWLTAKYRFTEDEDDGGDHCLLLEEPASLKVQRTRSIIGYEYTLTLSLRTLYFDDAERLVVKQMERMGHDFIIERMNGVFFLLRYFAPAQKVEHEVVEEDGRHGSVVTVTMKNVSGVQSITSSSSS